MAPAVLREELTCPICLSIFKDPVLLRCGHNFCLGCIEKVLRTQDILSVYICPLCSKRFTNRPALQRNLKLCNIVGVVFPTHQGTHSEVFCTYGILSPVPATKSCLHCEASLCDAHLRAHSKSEEHVFTEPTTSWGNRKCSIHKKLLEYYCTEDAACICASCSLVGEHRGHQVELLNEASEKKKQKLRDVLQKLFTKIEKTEKRVQKQESHRADFCGAEKGDNEDSERDDKQVPAGEDLGEGLSSVTLYRGLADIVTDIKKRLYVQVTSDLLLDVNTAPNTVTVSGDLKTASWTELNQEWAESSQRFTDNVPQVLSTRSFSSGQHYWEVATSEEGEWGLAVCYPNIERQGDASELGKNNKSWAFYGNENKCTVVHNTIISPLSHCLSCDRVGILLDYEGGRLSFYELSDPIKHLQTFTATFTEPLHAAFWVGLHARVSIMT
ncbi:E3 ubiquitin/ISG15 ligase TRIM25-like [Bombina bombina]|uniref:E3 ubiquitin/ISG15 ligase TRIM25-like n=1 Tax=Bombina bombina TaxID=8345 RepID=UPI00235B2CF5|nr:E3 ubiquitin/ISG15 ligase TRIM25-like [Bombina bombina]